MISTYKRVFLSKTLFKISSLSACFLVILTVVMAILFKEVSFFLVAHSLLRMIYLILLRSAYNKGEHYQLRGAADGIILIELIKFIYVLEFYFSAGRDVILSWGG